MAEKKNAPASQKYLALADMINRTNLGGKLPEFSERFHVIGRSDGTKSILAEGDFGVVTPVVEDAVIDAIIRYTTALPKYLKGYDFDHGAAVKAMRYWRSITEPISEPALLLELSEPGLCYRRLPFDSEYDPAKTPLFDELLSRIPCNAQALKAFMGSLFYENADRQQYVYLYGEGGNGKGSLTRLLQRIFGAQYQAENSVIKPNQFWMSGLVNKRLVVFSEANNSKIGMSEMIKTITGDDPVRIEEKNNKQIVTAMLRCKVMIVSNHSPTISSGYADQRRIILCEAGALTGNVDSRYDQKLWAEAPFIIGACKEAYRACSGEFGVIPVDKSLSQLAALESEQELFDLFEQNFVKGGSFSIAGSELRYMLKGSGVVDTMRIKDFVAYMVRVHGVRKMRKEQGVIYFGIRSKLATERQAHMTIVKNET